MTDSGFKLECKFESRRKTCKIKFLCSSSITPSIRRFQSFYTIGRPIAESLVILEYIDETWTDNPILPRYPYDRAMVQFWAKFIDEKPLWVAWDAFSSKEEDRDKAIEEA
ncbi:hypothetical protein AAG906_032655 [Vitis piasezkii]